MFGDERETGSELGDVQNCIQIRFLGGLVLVSKINSTLAMTELVLWDLPLQWSSNFFAQPISHIFKATSKNIHLSLNICKYAISKEYTEI